MRIFKKPKFDIYSIDEPDILTVSIGMFDDLEDGEHTDDGSSHISGSDIPGFPSY